ncbi:MAG TPA: hypothetical protein VFV75_20450, partial [Candidatus Polarisedimenticolaceae bacterium]|nr:hypothetical protein [Candidatus Polarisedimenticolaceae bacterium]
MPRPSQLLVLACFLAACSAHQPPVPEEPTGIGRLEVVVVDGADKQPLPAARVTLSHARGYVKDTTVQADGNGIASFPVLRPG